MKLRLWPLGIAALWYCTSTFAATVDFAQITDPHIFDCKGDVEGNKKALEWCINQINARVGANADYKFIVVTGDLGLEGLPCGGNEKEPAPAVGGKAKELADIIKESKVKQWLFLPGNNDLVGEDPENIGTFHRFIDALKEKAPPEMQIVDFCPRDGDQSSGILDIGGCRFIGFNNASFKSNDSADAAKKFEAKQRENVDEVIARLADPRFKSAYIFYHIPEIDDPYCTSLDPTKPEDNEILKKREANRGEIGKEFPCSAWTVTRLVRDKWNLVVANDRVKGLFAGHFHSAAEESYTGLGWIRSAGYPPGSLLKLQVCPPVASKKQEDKPTQARGFREVSVDCEKEERKSQVFWYRKDAGEKFKIVEKDLVLSVDGNNTASGLIHFSNPTEKEISLSLSADDFKSGNGDYGLNTKVLFALATAPAAGQPILEVKIPPSNTIAVKVDLSNFWEAGEATANLCNFGEPIGKLRAAKWRPPFAVKIVSATPDKPELTFTKGKTRQLTLKNDDPMTYVIAVTVEVDGTWSEPSVARLSPSSSVAVEVTPRDEWFPGTAWLKETVREGNIRLNWQVANAGGPPGIERIVPFKAQLRSGSEVAQTTWAYLFVLILVTLGGLCSMVLSNWVPNRLSRAAIDEQLSDLARKTTALSTRIDSGLRVFLRVERNRLHRLLKSALPLSANFSEVVKKASDQLSILTRQVDLAGELDRARQALNPLLQTDPIPVKIDQIDRDLQKAADLLRRCDCNAQDLDSAKLLISGAADRISKIDQSDTDLVAELARRIEGLKAYVQPATEPDSLKEAKKLFPKLFAKFDPSVTADKLDPKQYSPVDLLTAQLELVRQYQAYYRDNPPPAFPRQEEGMRYLHTDTIAGLRQARLLLREIQEGIDAEQIENALKNGGADIVVEPMPMEEQLVRFTVRFHSEDLDTAAAREEFHCAWDFGHHGLKEHGWEAYHYFPTPRARPIKKIWRRLFPIPNTYVVSATFSKRVSQDANPATVTISRKIEVAPRPRGSSADRQRAEYVRLIIALCIALVGLLAGAREQLIKLDLVPALVAVFLLGFGADTIKNLISPKQAQK